MTPLEALHGTAATIWREAEDLITTLTVALIGEKCRAHNPKAAYYALESSDQGPHLTYTGMYDADMKALDDEEFDDEGLAAWLAEDGPWMPFNVAGDWNPRGYPYLFPTQPKETSHD